MRERFDASRLVITLGLTLFVAGSGMVFTKTRAVTDLSSAACGPLFLAPLSEFYGRRELCSRYPLALADCSQRLGVHHLVWDLHRIHSHDRVSIVACSTVLTLMFGDQRRSRHSYTTGFSRFGWCIRLSLPERHWR